MKISEDCDLKPLVLAVVIRAAKEASGSKKQAPSIEARRWMRNEAIIWLDAVGVNIHPTQIAIWVGKDCRIPKRLRKQSAMLAEG